ncbi:MAG: hypothetical protein J5634_00400 [Bacilli bacterium]|nr:hypothetical protein [Bacilli bacterium]
MKKICSYLGVLLLGLFIVPNLVSALDIDKIKENKELVINAVTPTDDDSFFITEDWWSMKNDYNYYLGDCSADYTKCNIYKEGNLVASDIAIKYEYDPVVKTVVENIIKKVPSTGKDFILSDIEMVFYAKYTQYFWAHLDPNANLTEADYPNPIRFSSEYKEFIGYKNFVFEPRMGYEAMYADYMGGTATFEYNDTLYGTTDGIGTKVNYVLYVPDDTTDIIKALEDKLKPYFPDVTITYDSTGSAQDSIASEVNYYKEQYTNCKTYRDNIMAIPENERDYSNNDVFRENYTNYNNSCGSFGSYESQEFGDPDVYAAELEADLKANEYAAVLNAEPGFYLLEFENGQGLYFPVVKDSSKIVNKELNITTVDSASNVEIKTKANIPLDTLIEVARITSGEEYNAIVKLLNKTDVEMFDLKLFSKSANNYIKKLDDGNFEVKLPVKDEFKGKDLVVYYVDENNKVVEYKVTLTDDGFAVFTTDHFSIYTLTIADPKEDTTTVDETTPSETKEEEKKINNPATADNITIYFGLFTISALSLVVMPSLKKVK